jgi:hypothetical protein
MSSFSISSNAPARAMPKPHPALCPITGAPTNPTTTMSNKASTPTLPFSVDYTQHGNGLDLAAFSTEAEAITFAEAAWSQNHDHPDFARGGEDRGRWSVIHNRFDSDGEVEDSETLWSKKADERQ